METRLSQLMVLPLAYYELAPLQHFLNLSSLPPVKLKDIYHNNNGKLKCVLTIPSNLDPALLRQMWYKWREESLVSEYAIKN